MQFNAQYKSIIETPGTCMDDWIISWYLERPYGAFKYAIITGLIKNKRLLARARVIAF